MKLNPLRKLGLIPLMLVSGALSVQGSLRFDGVNDYVTFGVASGLGATNFTIECWFKREGAGTPTSTGTGGINVIPLVSKGRAENEAGFTNMNYFFGVGTNNLLAADFEDKNNGSNHPISATTNPAASNAWQHVAATYNVASSNWIIYLNGAPISTGIVSGAILVRTPERNSIEHAALGSALTTAGVAAGFFQGSMEEVRIWNYARTGTQISTAKNQRIISATGLIGRWPLTETGGTIANDTSGSGINGTLLNGPIWVTDSPLSLSVAISSPADNATFTTGANITLAASASAPTSSVTNVAYYAGVTKLGDATTGPNYNLTWNSVPTGNYALTAVVSDNTGATSTSAPVNISVAPVTVGLPGGLRFDGVDDIVTLGTAPGLGVTNFTIECWFKRQGVGKRANTGTSGLYALPLVTKGMAENESGATNMNYFFGVGTNAAGQTVLAADFEDFNNGLNHPVVGVSVVGSNVWQHGAVTYNSASSNWVLYLNGVADVSRIITGPSGITNLLMLIPRADSLQHAAFGSSLHTGGTTNADSGFFNGTMNEIRIWNYARSAAQIAASYNQQITNAPGLIGRWPLTETSGTTANDTSDSGINGTLLHGPIWVTDNPLALSVAITVPANGAVFTTGANIALAASASSPAGSSVTNVAYYADVTKLGDATVGPNYNLTWSAVPNGNYSLSAVVSDNTGATNTSSPVNISVTSGGPAETNLVFNFTNIWRYQQNSNLDGTTWKQPAYNDSSWPSGPGILGLEDCNCLPQPILTPLTLFTNRITHYFRTHFNFSGNPADVSLLFSSLIDNGAVFYLNGTEIQRVRMPSGTITDTTTASESVGNATTYDTFTISGGLLSALVVGDNLLAAEVHQADFQSSDVVFGSSLSVVSGSVTNVSGSGGLSFDGVDDLVTFGVAPALGVTNFTIECWFKPQGAGKRSNTGNGGIYAVPLVTKGMAENEIGVTNMNYFLGIGTNNSGQAVLAADFEDFNTGLNHPIRGTALVSSNAWQHAAVTYNVAGSNWVLYLNGVADVTNIITGPSGITNLLMLLPRYDSIEHAALGSSLHTGGTINSDTGFFAGTMDEVRTWNYPRTALQIADNYNRQITNASGLIARWSLDETAGTIASNSISGGVNGALANGPVWAAGYPFPVPVNLPPPAPIVVSPTNGAPNITANATLTVTVSDPEANNLTVTYYGRVANGAAAPGPDFTLIALPDTQFYVSSLNGGLPDMFTNQTQWIVNNRASRNIQYLAQLGDCVQNGDNGGNNVEWMYATNSLYRLENPLTTSLPEGLPYGVAVGNHDQSPIGSATGTTAFYNQYFGSPHFQGQSYYGDHYGTNNDNHYDLFSASGLDFIVIYFEYDTTMTTSSPVLAWANSVLATNQNRRAIVVSHWIINAGFNASFSAQGQAIYDALKGNTNLFLMLCGHVSPEEGQRTDTYQGRTVWTIMTDYQGRAGGGNGWLRLYEFSPANNIIRATTYSPWLNQTETDADSQFNFSYNMTTANPFSVLGTSASVPSGSNASLTWSNLVSGVQYEWFVSVSDGVNTTNSPVMNFTVGNTGTSNNQPPVANSQSLTNAEDTARAITLTGSDPEGSNLTFTVVSAPTHGVLTGIAPNLTYTPVLNYNGSDSLTFRVSDGSLTSLVATVSISVTPVNDPPGVTGVANQTINMNGTSGPLNFTISDVDTAIGSLIITAGSSNPALLPTNNIIFGGSGSNRTVTATPIAGKSGSVTITMTVSDGLLSTNTNFMVAVTPLVMSTNSFTNTAAITIPNSGNATPYRSIINVSNLVGSVSNVTVTLRNINHTWPADVDVLLVGPAGQKAMIFSDVGGGNDLVNVTVTLSDAAASALSATAQIVAGTFKPTNVEPGESGEVDTFGAPAPGGPYASPLAAFNGTSANGAWSLYVVDDAAGDSGNIANGWSLKITTVSSGPVPAGITNQPAAQTVQCGSNAVLNVGASGAAPLNYQWYFGNVLLAGKTNNSLTLTGVSGANGGNYVVTVQNVSGSVTSAPALLTIIDTNPPVITTCATNLTLGAGTNCQIAIPNLISQIVASDSCGGVTITQSPVAGTLVGLGNALVTLTVKDAANNQATCSATITVIDGGVPVITAQPLNRTNIVGTSASFNVAATSCGAMSCQWMFGTNVLAGATSPTLTITNVQLGNMGSYRALLNNSAGNSTSSVATLMVQLPASPTVSSGPLMLANGHFYVGFTGTPGVPYTIQHAADVTGPWQTLTNLTADTNGFMGIEDVTTPVPLMRFYRAVYP